MTIEQQSEINQYKAMYDKNMQMYSGWNSEEIGIFNLYESGEDGSNSIILAITTIDRIDDSYSGVHLDERYYAIMPNGSSVDLLSSFKYDTSKVYEYVENLKKIN
jgi:hypothetical protein